MLSEDFAENREEQIKRKVEEYEKLCKKGEYNPYFSSQLYYEIAEYYASVDKIEVAIEVLSKAYKMHPFDFDVLYSLANYSFAIDKIEDSYHYATKAKILNPSASEILLLLAELYERKGEPDNSKKYFDASLAETPEQDEFRKDIYLSYASALQRFGAYEEAYNYLTLGVQSFPNDPHLIDEFDLCVSLMNREKSAIKFLNQCIDDYPLADNLWFMLSRCYERLEMFEKTEYALNRVLCLNKKNEYAWYSLGNVYLDLELYEKAFETFSELLKYRKNIQLAEIYSRQGEVWEALDENKKAIECYSKATAEDNNYAEAWYGMGMCLRKENNNPLALTYLLKALELENDSYLYLGALGRTYQAMEDFTNAEKYFKSALDIYPLDSLLWIDYAYLHYLNNFSVKALEILRKGYSFNPEAGELLYQSICVHLADLEFEQAEKLLELATEKYPDKKYWLFYNFSDLIDNFKITDLLSKYIKWT